MEDDPARHDHAHRSGNERDGADEGKAEEAGPECRETPEVQREGAARRTARKPERRDPPQRQEMHEADRETEGETERDIQDGEDHCRCIHFQAA